MSKEEQTAQNLTDEELRTICKEIYDWKFINGSLDQEGKLKQILESDHYDITVLLRCIEDEAVTRFREIVLLLMRKRPECFLKAPREG